MRFAFLLVLVTAGNAAADDRPTIAVSINTSVPESGKLNDQARTVVRQLADAKTGPYRQRATPKEVTAALIKAECQAMEPACGTKVGVALGVDYFLAGNVDRRAEHLVVQLVLVNVKTKQRVRSARGVATAATLDRTVRTTYAQLVGAATGELTVVVNAKQGDVVLDGQTVGQLWEGRATISGLSLGGHELQVRAKGYKPISVDIRIDGSNTETLLLEVAGT